MIKDKGIFNPGSFNLGPAVTIKFQQGESLTVSIHKQIIEEIRSKSKAAIQNQS